MPRKNFRKKFRRSRPRRSRGGAIARLSRRINGLAKVAASEKKYHDLTGGPAVSATPTLILLNGVQQGDTGATREGQSITMLYSWLQFDAIVNSSATASVMRVILVYDMQANGAAFAASDLLVTSTNLNSPFVIGYSRRFRIMWDMRFNLSTVGSNYQIIRKKFRKMSHKTQYNTGNAGTVADITTGSLYLLVVSDEATNTPTFSYYHRLRFAG